MYKENQTKKKPPKTPKTRNATLSARYGFPVVEETTQWLACGGDARGGFVIGPPPRQKGSSDPGAAVFRGTKSRAIPSARFAVRSPTPPGARMHPWVGPRMDAAAARQDGARNGPPGTPPAAWLPGRFSTKYAIRGGVAAGRAGIAGALLALTHFTLYLFLNGPSLVSMPFAGPCPEDKKPQPSRTLGF